MLQSVLLKIFILVQGLGAASGLVYHKKQIYMISDDQAYVYQYDTKKDKQHKIELNTTISAKEITKKNKLDFESIVLINHKLYCLGSGSKANRNEMLIYDIKKKTSERYDLTSLYQIIRSSFHIDEKDFNIEGVAYANGNTYLFNRGNGPKQTNGIIVIKGLPNDYDDKNLKFIPIQLPIINGQQTTFSDALIVDNQIIYTATIEAESTIQQDGEVKESIIGAIDLRSFALKKYKVIAKNQKIEGITLMKKTSKYYHFLLCEDNDDDSAASKVYELEISKDLADIK